MWTISISDAVVFLPNFMLVQLNKAYHCREFFIGLQSFFVVDNLMLNIMMAVLGSVRGVALNSSLQFSITYVFVFWVPF
jgi:hypothetical protein